jgi:hypothetical protein
MEARDLWHKANTAENVKLFAKTFMTGFSLADLNYNLRKLMENQVPGAAGVTQLLRPILFSEADQKAISERQAAQSKAEVMAQTQAAQGQILRDVSDVDKIGRAHV